MDNEQALGMDPYMLLSWINMKLRDENVDIDELCSIYDIDKVLVLKKLYEIGYRYDSEVNQIK